jgi:hypothetical protein
MNDKIVMRLKAGFRQRTIARDADDQQAADRWPAGPVASSRARGQPERESMGNRRGSGRVRPYDREDFGPGEGNSSYRCIKSSRKKVCAETKADIVYFSLYGQLGSELGIRPDAV